MKKILLFFGLLMPVALMAQHVVQLPTEVDRFIVEGTTTLQVKQGTPTRIEYSKHADKADLNYHKFSLCDNRNTATLYLAPGRGMSIVGEGPVEVCVNGNFDSIPFLGISLYACAKASFEGAEGDTLQVDSLTLKLEGLSVARFDMPFRAKRYTCSVDDYCYIFGPGDADESDSESKAVEAIGDLIRSIPWGSKSPWHSHIGLQWGLNSWGSSMLGAFQGTNSPAATNFSANHWMLTFDYPLIRERRFALYLGIGVEWDKYKFQISDVAPDYTLDPMAFASATDLGNTSMKMRYVVVPVEVAIGTPRKWSLHLGVVGGLYWGGNNTGLRYESVSNDVERRTKDLSINHYVAPLKLDARVMVKYRGIGAYLQVPLTSAFNNGFEPLYPLKFGIVL